MSEVTALTMRLGGVSSRRGIRGFALDVIDAFDTIFKKLVNIKIYTHFFQEPLSSPSFLCMGLTGNIFECHRLTPYTICLNPSKTLLCLYKVS